MKTIINIDGGIGRVVCAIPALLKYHKNHPNDEWYVMINGWDFVTWGIPELQERTFNPESKGIFENYYWDADKVITPEPYKLPSFYRNEISLRVAFDKIINETDDHSDLPDLTLNLSIDEILNAKEVIKSIKQQYPDKSKVVVYQPYGSSAYQTELGVYDKSMRSITNYMNNILIEKLSKNYILINMSSSLPNISGSVFVQPDPDLRTWVAIIKEADYFIGCDSCGQHFAKAVGTDASVVIAGTHEVNMSYPESFHIIKRDVKYYPAPMRVSYLNSMLSDKLNESRNAFTEEEIKTAYDQIIKNIEKNSKKVSNSSQTKDSSKGFSK